MLAESIQFLKSSLVWSFFWREGEREGRESPQKKTVSILDFYCSLFAVAFDSSFSNIFCSVA